MKLIYKDKEIMTTTTTNKNVMRYKFQKIYYATIIEDCNRYSSIASKQRVDIALVDDNLNIIAIKKNMHENTFFENENATKTIIIPLNYFENLEENTNFQIK